MYQCLVDLDHPNRARDGVLYRRMPEIDQMGIGVLKVIPVIQNPGSYDLVVEKKNFFNVRSVNRNYGIVIHVLHFQVPPVYRFSSETKRGYRTSTPAPWIADRNQPR